MSAPDRQSFLKSENFFRESYKQKDSFRGDTAVCGKNFQYFENDIFRYKYNGQEKDEGTGLLYYKARYYDPEIGRFITADSIIPDITRTQCFNPYMFCTGDPIGKMDWDGHEESSDSSGDSTGTGSMPAAATGDGGNSMPNSNAAPGYTQMPGYSAPSSNTPSSSTPSESTPAATETKSSSGNKDGAVDGTETAAGNDPKSNGPSPMPTPGGGGGGGGMPTPGGGYSGIPGLRPQQQQASMPNSNIGNPDMMNHLNGPGLSDKQWNELGDSLSKGATYSNYAALVVQPEVAPALGVLSLVCDAAATACYARAGNQKQTIAAIGAVVVDGMGMKAPLAVYNSALGRFQAIGAPGAIRATVVTASGKAGVQNGAMLNRTTGSVLASLPTIGSLSYGEIAEMMTE